MPVADSVPVDGGAQARWKAPETRETATPHPPASRVQDPAAPPPRHDAGRGRAPPPKRRVPADSR